MVKKKKSKSGGKKKHKGKVVKAENSSLAQADKQKKFRLTHTHSEIEQYTGPIPDPKTLEHYNNICPGAADRILKMAEEQASHRQYIEKLAIGSDANNSKMGIWAGTLISLGIMILSGIIAFMGYPTVGASLVGGNIISIAGIFIYGTKSRRREREIKYKNLK